MIYIAAGLICDASSRVFFLIAVLIATFERQRFQRDRTDLRYVFMVMDCRLKNFVIYCIVRIKLRPVVQVKDTRAWIIRFCFVRHGAL